MRERYIIFDIDQLKEAEVDLEDAIEFNLGDKAVKECMDHFLHCRRNLEETIEGFVKERVNMDIRVKITGPSTDEDLLDGLE